jgi:MoaA/NifB/PqqE/SkfB family radical SAM enzyme
MEVEEAKLKLLTGLLGRLVHSKIASKAMIYKLEKEIYKAVNEHLKGYPLNVRLKKYELIRAILNTAVNNLQRGFISKQFFNFVVNFVGAAAPTSTNKQVATAFREKYGEKPPAFLVVSPTQRCNLQCTGCYAASTALTAATLPYEVLEKAVGESYNTFGSRFTTISGGEPFLYEDSGKTLFDIWEKFNDMAFLVYTNGKLITEENAHRLAELGNVTPAISVEGFRKETDARRGDGMFQRILKSMELLRKAKVPFGVSVTATRKNIELLLSDEFYDFFFDKERASYMWMFHLMPIGRAKEDTDLMITAQERVRLYRQIERMTKEKKRFVADFWNSGVTVDGCMAYGKNYFYIDWDGKIMPCVFVPYYVDNIMDIYKRGGSLTDAFFSDFFMRGRKWQRRYGSDNLLKPGNWLMPCSIRDHYDTFRKEILVDEAKAENINAQEALESREYYNVMCNFDRELHQITEPIWKQEFLQEPENNAEDISLRNGFLAKNGIKP